MHANALNTVRQGTKAVLAWLLQDKHKQYARSLQSLFTRHPEEAGETYLVHFWFTIRMGLRFSYVSFVILMHGVFPFLFTRTASVQVEQLYSTMKSRIPKERLEELNRQKIYARKRHDDITGEARIAIVGGGFSGLAVLVNLVQNAKRSMTIEWFESGGGMAEGVAYSTRNNRHLLNVAANKMGLLATQPEGFYLWLKTARGSTRAARLWAGNDIQVDCYAPRMLYAEYLQSVLDETLAEARQRGVEVNITHATVSDARLYNADAQQILLSIKQKDGEKAMLVDALVLATGNLPPRKFSFPSGILHSETNYIADVWKVVNSPDFIGRISELSERDNIVIIGTGLTMVDMVITLRTLGYKGIVTAISRNGLLPTEHQPYKEYPSWEWARDPRSAPLTAYGLLHRLRSEIKQATAQGYDWRAVIDSLRPVTQTLWQRLTIYEKRRFLVKLATFWNIHRHRMAPDVFAEIKTMRDSGKLTINAGVIYYAGEDSDGLSLSFRKHRTSQVTSIRPAMILNCVGPEYDIANSTHELLKNLRDREMITVGPLRVGIEVEQNGAAKGKASNTLFPVGPLLAGEFLECTAVPELRKVAYNTAMELLHRVEQIAHEDVAGSLSLGEWI